MRKFLFDEDGTLKLWAIVPAMVSGGVLLILAIVFSGPPLEWAFKTWADKWEYRVPQK